MSIFGRHSNSGAVGIGVQEAVAESIAARFGDMDDDDVFGLDDDGEDLDPEDVIAAADLELEIDDDLVDSSFEDILFDLDDASDDDEDDDENASEAASGEPGLPPGPSRRISLANSVRFGGDDSRPKPDRQAKQLERQQVQSGRVSLKQQRRSTPPGGLAQIVQAAVEAGMSARASTSSEPSGDPSAPWWQQVAQQVRASAPPAQPQAAPSAAPEAGAESLPPTYVADSVDVPADEKVGSLVEPRVVFGATADTGLVHRQVRPRAKKGAINAIGRSTDALSRVPYGASSAFVEDPNASPLLFGDGRIVDLVYGEMLACPCPSCAGVTRKAAFAGVGHDCSVCDGYGAILVPEGDVPSFMNSSSYGIIPLLVPLVGAGATLGVSAFQKGKAGEAESVEEKKRLVMMRLLKKKQEREAEAAAKSAGEAEVSSEMDKLDAELDAGDEKVSGLFGSDTFGFDDDSDLIDVDDDFGADDDGSDLIGFGDDGFGVDSWADEAFGSDDDEDDEDDEDDDEDDEDEDREDDEDDDDDDDDDEEESHRLNREASSHRVVRAMVPAQR